MLIRGAIYHHVKFRFHDGATGEKLLILLNTPSKSEPFIFVKTTSQQKNKPVLPGCIHKRNVFYIPQGGSFFKNNTWVQLYDIYPLTPDEIKKPEMIYKDQLSEDLIDEIVNCLFKCQEDDLSPKIKKMLRPQINESILKLQEKFNRKR